MSVTRKISGTASGAVPPRRALKLMYRSQMSAAEREEFWEVINADGVTLEQTRADIARRYGVQIGSKSVLQELRQWVWQQRAEDLMNDQLLMRQEQLTEEHKDWSREQIRAEVIKTAYAGALASGDSKLGLQVVATDLKAEQVQLDREKLELLKRRADMADATEKVMEDSQLTPEERTRRIAEIYGRA